MSGRDGSFLVRFLLEKLTRFYVAKAVKQAQRAFGIRRVWEEAGFDPKSVLKAGGLFADLVALKDAPILTADNFTKRFTVHERLLEGEKVGAYALSSGFTGGTKLTIVQPDDDARLAQLMGLFFKYFFGVDSAERVLVINTFYIGAHLAGMTLARVIPHMQAKKWPNLELINPGLDTQRAVQLLEALDGRHDAWFILGYPTSVGILAQEILSRRIKIPKKVNVLLSGEGHTVGWLKKTARILGIDLEGGFGSGTMLSYSGAAEVLSSISFQDREALQVSLWAADNPQLARDLFPQSHPFESLGQPMVFKASPTVYTENGEGEFQGELLHTCPGFLPVVRITLGDMGIVVPREQVLMVLRDHGYRVEEELKGKGLRLPLPFLFFWGRGGSASIWGITVPLTAIKQALDAPAIVDLNSGYFKIVPARMAGEKTLIRVTLTKGVAPAEVRERFKSALYRQLRQGISEIDSLCGERGEGSLDEALALELFEFPDGPFQESTRGEMKLRTW